MSQDIVRSYYASFGEREWNRLTTSEGAIEFSITTRTLSAYLPAQGRILDLGGGPGRYTRWLLERGYQVVLADPSPELLALAEQQLLEVGLREQVEAITMTDARDLSCWPDQAFDAVLCLGPFYHLPDPDDRARATRELLRVLRPGGLAFIAVMPSYALLRRTIALADERRHLAQPGFVTQLLEQGVFFNDIPGRFSAGSGMHPSTIASFFAQYGLSALALLACEGLASGIEDAVAAIAQRDPQLYQQVLDLLFQTAQDTSIHGMSGHLLYVGRKDMAQIIHRC